jgi:predicted XRE-type DNA-binding protein
MGYGRFGRIAMRNARQEIEVVASSGNVFADLGLAEEEQKQTRVRLAVAINEIIRARQMSQSAAARCLRVNQPKVSALLNYQTARLFR